MKHFDRYTRIHECMKDALNGREGWSSKGVMVELDAVLLRIAEEELEFFYKDVAPEDQPIQLDIRL